MTVNEVYLMTKILDSFTGNQIDMMTIQHDQMYVVMVKTLNT